MSAKPDTRPRRTDARILQTRESNTGANHQTGRAASGNPLGSYLLRHAQVLLSSLGHLYRHPLSTLMTIAVLGIALALPTGLVVALDNLQQISGGWRQGTQISLFMKDFVNDTQAQALSAQVGKRDAIAEVRVITKDEAMTEFRALSGFGAALDALEDNPLPVVLVVTPQSSIDTPRALQDLVDELRLLPEVDIAQLDMQWVTRLHAMLEMAQRTTWLIGGLLGLAVLLVVGNTIRLDIENRREEIEITKLIGATDAFIRRPFLYTGVWYGLAGGLLAALLINAALALLRGPATALSSLYNSGFTLSGLGFTGMLALLMLGVLLGLGGSWLAVGRHLKAIEPA